VSIHGSVRVRRVWLNVRVTVVGQYGADRGRFADALISHTPSNCRSRAMRHIVSPSDISL